jgi:hypothetical protein
MRRICSAIVGLLLLAAPAAAASDGRQAATAAAEAARALQQQAVRIAASGGRLDMTAGPAAENLRRVLDTKSFDELPPLSAADMPWIIDWLVAVRTTYFTIFYFGADPQQPMKLSAEQPERNVNQYEDEIARLVVFSQKLFPRVLATGQAFFETLPEKERNSKVRLEGFAKMITGYLESVEGALGFAAADGTKPANVRIIAAALRENAPVWIEMAGPDIRKRFAGFLKIARSKAGEAETADHFRAIEAALASAKS